MRKLSGYGNTVAAVSKGMNQSFSSRTTFPLVGKKAEIADFSLSLQTPHFDHSAVPGGLIFPQEQKFLLPQRAAAREGNN